MALLPCLFFCFAGLLLGKIKQALEAQKDKEAKLKDIKYLINLLKNAPDQNTIEEAVGAFTQYFIPFGEIAKDSKEYQDRMDFINSLALCPTVEIDYVVRYRESFVKSNPSFKKEIETVIGSALKTRESEKSKK